MNKNYVAVYTRTESGDESLDLYEDVTGTKDVLKRLKEDFGQDFAYIGALLIKTSGGIQIHGGTIWDEIYIEQEKIGY